MARNSNTYNNKTQSIRPIAVTYKLHNLYKLTKIEVLSMKPSIVASQHIHVIMHWKVSLFPTSLQLLQMFCHSDMAYAHYVPLSQQGSVEHDGFNFVLSNEPPSELTPMHAFIKKYIAILLASRFSLQNFLCIFWSVISVNCGPMPS